MKTPKKVGPSAVWKHKSMFGWARMMHTQCEMIIHSPTATREAKATALRIQNEVHVLMRQLKTRVDK